jgi:hypothetical protein
MPAPDPAGGPLEAAAGPRRRDGATTASFLVQVGERLSGCRPDDAVAGERPVAEKSAP